MSRRLLSICCAIWALFATLSFAGAQDRVALVIGNGNYQHATALPNPANDARAVAAALRDIGFDITEGVDLDRAGMERRIRDFLRKAASARLALFFYAGHGMQVDGKNYLVPVDAKLEAASDLSFETIDLDKILDTLNDPARTSIVILDACRDNPLARSFARRLGATRSAAVPSGLAAYSTIGTGMLIAFATAPGQVALDGRGNNSPFTRGLLRHLRTPGLEVRQMLTRVRSDVAAATHHQQIPWDNSSLLGDVYLAGLPQPNAAVPTPTPAPPAPTQADDETLWRAVKDTTAPALFEDFLRRFPGSTHAGEARSRLVELQRSQSAALTPPPLPPIAEMRRPIDALYTAWGQLDLRGYLDQWAAEAIKIDLKSGQRSTLRQLARDRARMFRQLSRVDSEHQVTLQNFDNGVAEFDVTYRMTFRYRSGRVFTERACESYRVREEGGRWLIIENQDYKPCRARRGL
ncbi:MAG: caspase domain-containing protein [Xanthobacteraceae bacterium]